MDVCVRAYDQIAGLQSPEGDLLCLADSWRVANEISNAAALPGSAGWISVADSTVSGSNSVHCTCMISRLARQIITRGSSLAAIRLSCHDKNQSILTGWLQRTILSLDRPRLLQEWEGWEGQMETAIW